MNNPSMTAIENKVTTGNICFNAKIPAAISGFGQTQGNHCWNNYEGIANPRLTAPLQFNSRSRAEALAMQGLSFIRQTILDSRGRSWCKALILAPRQPGGNSLNHIQIQRGEFALGRRLGASCPDFCGCKPCGCQVNRGGQQQTPPIAFTLLRSSVTWGLLVLGRGLTQPHNVAK